ncbi:MAG: FHIPEP family type III secretion protein [Myxococcales bacterium]|nr:FHIPEP family type III secretion protein [Myxococcales bacterium]MCB9716015.1 FHIPEP family type III secretion protein [Myxococcales bacterium]
MLTRKLWSGGALLLGGLPGLAPTFLVVALLACVLVPLPTGLVDLLLSMSLAGAVLLLVASLGVRRSTELLSFPTLLLLITLYRLAINVSTTRLILSQADAGRVVDAFATFVVRDDLVVGGVMFAIISVIQYLVIARGSERVAEVAARFALDGLPGHQQAIEADLRAGLSSPAEAARRRARLVERSSFYGAMDGAVRFVKGDAVAGLAITAINLAGGLAIGVGRMGLGWQESLETYGRLTIGDGLLAQIPALLVSLAAGVLVSRVDEATEGSGRRWLEPAMLLVPATALLVLAVVPQMPGLAFVTTATALVTCALLLASFTARRPSERSEAPGIRLRLHPRGVDDPRGLERALAELGDRCHDALGVELPRFRLHLDPEAPLDAWELRDGPRLLRRAALPEPATTDSLLLAVFRAVMDHAPSLVDLQDLEDSLEALRATHPVLVRRALEAVDSIDLLAIVRGFLRERVPRPPLPAILGAVAEDRRFHDPAERPRHVERVREHLAGHWVPPVLDSLRRLGSPRWVRLSPDAEEELLERTVAAGDRLVLRMPAKERERWVQSLRTLVEDDDAGAPVPSRGGQPTVVLASPRARPAVAALLGGVVPHVPVLSTAELEASAVELHPQWRWMNPPEPT